MLEESRVSLYTIFLKDKKFQIRSSWIMLLTKKKVLNENDSKDCGLDHSSGVSAVPQITDSEQGYND